MSGCSHLGESAVLVARNSLQSICATNPGVGLFSEGAKRALKSAFQHRVLSGVHVLCYVAVIERVCMCAQAILSGDARALPPSVSTAAQSFLSACLQRNPASRPSVSELLEHAWIQVSSRKIRQRAQMLISAGSQASVVLSSAHQSIKIIYV